MARTDPRPGQETAKELQAEMKSADLPPELRYAYQKTGVYFTEENAKVLGTDDLMAVNAAVDEYFALKEKGQIDDNF